MTGRQMRKSFVGEPDGPLAFIAEFDREVGTFLERCAELEDPLYQDKPCLMYHVPNEFRGPYKPDDMLNRDETQQLKVTLDGYVRCTRAALTGIEKQCSRKAVNRSLYCATHGGKLHPFDKPKQRDVTTMTRQELLTEGLIDPEDLDDEELIRGMARSPEGNFYTDKARKRAIPKHIYDKMVQRLFERANEKFRENLLSCVESLAEIANGTAFEPADRIRAATYIVDRVLGKTAEKIDMSVGLKPYQEILTGIAPLTREESRAQRSLMGQIGELEAIPSCGACGATMDGNQCPECGVIEGEVEWTEESSTGPLSNGARRADTLTQTYLRARDDHAPTAQNQENSSDANAPGKTSHTSTSKENHHGPMSLDQHHAQERPGKTKEEITAETKAARARRYAARAQGQTSTRNLGYVRAAEDLGDRWRVRWIAPEDVTVPATVKAKETKRRNRERYM